MSNVAFARVIRASFLKNWRLSTTYPSWLVNRIVGPAVWVAISVYAYTGVASSGDVSAAFKRTTGSGDFIGFLILGQTVFSFFTGMNWRGGMAIQRERWMGTLELVLLSPASRLAFVLGESLFGLIDSGWTVFLALLISFWAFGIHFALTSPVAALLAMLLTLSSMVALGVFLSAFYMLTRSAGAFSNAVQAPIRFFSGTQFPIGALPLALQGVSYAIPVTYGSLAVRRALLAGASVRELAPDLLVLAGATVLFLALGTWLLGRMERLAKERGSLHAY